jgi:hypothetical protein
VVTNLNHRRISKKKGAIDAKFSVPGPPVVVKPQSA